MKKLITDLKDIARLTRRNKKINFSFRAKLKASTSSPDDESRLDARVHALHEEISGKIDCRACGNCCKAYDIVLVDEADRERLSEALGRTTEELTSRYLITAEGHDMPGIKAKPCPFLRGNDCGHYEARPETCRDYPHLTAPGFLGRTLEVLSNCGICPIVFNVWERLKDEVI
jgi:uncharacterized protein